MKFRYTEEVLNSKTWVDGSGEAHELEGMDKDYLHCVLFYLYKNRNRYWLNCRKVKMIESFEDGDEFFQKIIRNSTLWQSIIGQLSIVDDETFNFPWEYGNHYKKESEFS